MVFSMYLYCSKMLFSKAFQPIVTLPDYSRRFLQDPTTIYFPQFYIQQFYD